ncbi:unnamed protein product [Plutella xylostella]|uniref:(diamondback moth) hypothetical protein n=1 Tax=Plutella xylostella TaxID=51655 RepID=A0A8S4G0G8_PLUXY|nr:unnamed protein product [Plutella xylostella]
MYAAAGGASIAGRKARQHGRLPAAGSPGSSPPHPAPCGVRAYSCQHWEARLSAPPSRAAPDPDGECVEVRLAATQRPSVPPATQNRHKTGKYAGSAYAKIEIAGETQTAIKERIQTRAAEQCGHQADRALPQIPAGFLGGDRTRELRYPVRVTNHYTIQSSGDTKVLDDNLHYITTIDWARCRVSYYNSAKYASNS